jgi:hypothetical protein
MGTSYKLVVRIDVHREGFEDAVNKAVANGWCLLGGASVSYAGRNDKDPQSGIVRPVFVFAQAVTKDA